MVLRNAVALLVVFLTYPLLVVSFGVSKLVSPHCETSWSPRSITRLAASRSTTNPSKDESSAILIYGHPGTRSPLVNWACLELDVPFQMGDLNANPHPFQQLPCLQDAGDVVVFESGAILQYLQQTYGNEASNSHAASILSWIVWANASFDPVCFLETPQGKVYDTGLRKPNRKTDRLNALLSSSTWLVGNNFTIADVAVASYGLYVLLFFPDVSIAKHWPSLAEYLLRAAQRPAYAKAFGNQMQAQLVTTLQKDLKKYAA